MQLRPNILVISDLHLGEQLRPEGATATATEAALISFLNHHGDHRVQGRPWHLIVNGDLVDFIAICLMPAEAKVVQGLDDDAHWYGVGGDSRAAHLKLAAVMERQPRVFQALARFVGLGHSLSLVMGNHDAAFHWPAVQDLLRHALAAHWAGNPLAHMPGARSQAQVLSAVEFHPWFWFEEGVAWIEHGHQYDPYCSFDDVLAPANAAGELDVNVGGAILTYVTNLYVRDVAGQWGSGFFGYLGFWASQSASRSLGILGGYRDMIRRLVSAWAAREPGSRKIRRARASLRLARVAARAGVPVHVLRRLIRLQTRPVVSDLGRLLRAVMVDRLLLLVCTPLLAALWLAADWWAVALIALLLTPLVISAFKPRDTVDPRPAFRKVSRRIRELTRVPIVVFGHSHVPMVQRDGPGWYFNTGSWVPHGDHCARAFTHLRIERHEGRVSAKLMQWRDGAARVFSGH